MLGDRAGKLQPQSKGCQTAQPHLLDEESLQAASGTAQGQQLQFLVARARVVASWVPTLASGSEDQQDRVRVWQGLTSSACSLSS